jgi:SAM-dependent methyltransferase
VSTQQPTTPTPAHAYQAYFGPAIFEPLADQVVACATPAPGDRVVDVACGTGILTRRLAAAAGAAGRVVGVDVNPGMIAVARELPAGPGAAVEYRHGDGTALQFFPDRAAGAREMRRLVVAGGRAVVAAWRGLDHHPLYAALADAEEPHLTELGVEITRAELEAPFSLGDADQLAGLLQDAGFGRVAIRSVSVEARFADADRFVERMEFAYAAVIPQFVEDADAFASYLDTIGRVTQGIVESHRRGDEVVVPMHAHVAIAS